VSPPTMGSMIRRLREAHGLTQLQLAKKVGVTQSYIAQLESGRRTSPSLARLKRLAKALDVHVSALLE
jgi:transcriptional regulator with XRE-family HTH domain